MQHGYEKFEKMYWTKKLTTKIYPPLPIDVSKAVLQDGRQNSVCGLSFGISHGMTIDDELKKINIAMKHL